MARPILNTVILAKIEATYGSDPTPTGAANAILVTNQSAPRLVANNVDRALVRGYYGGNQQLVGTRVLTVGFDVEIAGSGTPTTAPDWGPLMRACGFTQTSQTASMDYTPISTISGVTNTSVTIYYYLDGQLYKLLGARGNMPTITLGIGARPVFRFEFTGLDGGLTAATNATPTLSRFSTPVVVTDANTLMTLGSITYTAATGVLSGGTEYPNRGLSVSIGNNVVHQPLLGAETVEITGREVTCEAEFDLTAAQAVTFNTDVLANTNTGFGITHGTSAGNIVCIHMPAVQRINPEVVDVNGSAFHKYAGRAVPSTGNDEIRIVAR